MTLIKMVTAWGEEHGLIDTLTNSCEFNDFKHMRPDIKEKLKKDKAEDAKLEKVEYLNRNGKHERLEKTYCRWAGDPLLKYKLIPGKVYELPKGFINEVNSMKTTVRSGLLEVDGEKYTKDGSPLERDTEGDWVHKLVKV